MRSTKEKHTIKIVPSRVRREHNAVARERNLRTAERERKEEVAEEEARHAALVRRRQQHLHKSGKQRATTEDGLEEESDESDLEERGPQERQHLDEVMSTEKEPEQPTEATTVSGEVLSAESGIDRVLGALRSRGGCSPMTASEIEHHSGIRLLDPANSGFKKRLCQSSGVVVVYELERELSLKNAAPLGIECKSDLVHLFTHLLPAGNVKTQSGRRAYAVSEEELQGAYPQLSMDLDHLIAEGVVDFYIDESRDRWRILLPVMPFAAESTELLAMWKACPYPASDGELKESAHAAGVRPLLRLNTADERNKEHKQKADRRAALQKQPRSRKPSKAVPVLVVKGSKKPGGSFADIYD
tara:strand:- start:485 stop:1555 length:1071 start_codon:yes stop_codon:yes gene_type:complete